MLRDSLANMWKKSRNRGDALCLLVHEPEMSCEQCISTKDKSHSATMENSCLLFEYISLKKMSVAATDVTHEMVVAATSA